MSRPEHRSSADLQSISDSLISPAGFVLSGNLPDGKSSKSSHLVGYTDAFAVLSAYESDHHMAILDPSEAEAFRKLCSQHSDLELGTKELFSFLR